jgi:DegV family protein with EDD domain
MSIAIVTDSTADLPLDLVTANSIQVVPAILIINGQQLEDGEGISRQEFYQRLPSMNSLPTTSTPAAGKFEIIYEKLFRSGVEQIVSIHAPALLSGIVNAAQVAAKKFGKKVHILDSGQVTLGLGFQVLGAAEAAGNGLPLADILERVEDIRQRIHLVAMLDTLEYVRRSGRVSWAKASIGTLLQIKPFVGLKDGIVLRLGETRTRHKGIDRLYGFLKELGPLERLAILHTNTESEARQMMQEFIQQVSTSPLIVNVTTVIGTHVGPNALGFVAVTQ